jgi:hypothetical protein
MKRESPEFSPSWDSGLLAVPELILSPYFLKPFLCVLFYLK